MTKSTALYLPGDRVATAAPGMLVGRKASGLLRLPEAWVPPFFLLSTLLYQRWESAESPASPSSLNLTSLEASILQQAIDTLHRLGARKLLVRSSADSEDLQARGRFMSIEAGLSPISVLKNVVRVYEHSKKVAIEGVRLGVVVQSLIQPSLASGHLSNERRLSPDPRDWLCEIESGTVGSLDKVVPVEPANDAVSRMSCDSSLVCRTEEELHSLWSDLAGWVIGKSERLHFEWLWDGNRLWILQADLDETYRDRGPRIARFRNRGEQVEDLTPRSFRALVRAQDLPRGLSQKADWIRAFEQQGLPTGRIWGLHLPAKSTRLMARGEGPDGLSEDLASMIKQPVVIRTDLPAQEVEAQNQLFLPHSATIESVRDGLRFITDVCREVKDHGRENGVVFLIHHLIPSLAAALCYADPDSDTSFLESTWGLPDGLQYCPHDSFRVGESGSRILSRRIRFKDTIVDVADDGSWGARPLGEPWDWRSSLSDDEVLTIAAGSIAVARASEKPLQIMWFAGVQDRTYPSCLPWHVLFADLEKGPPAPMSSIVHLHLAMRLRIETKEDQKRALQTLESEGTCSAVIELRPRSSLLRSRTFLQATADLANRFDVPVILHGGVLSHAYYILRRAGVVVLSPNDNCALRAG